MSVKIMLDAGHHGNYNHSPVLDSYYESHAMWKLHLLLKQELEAFVGLYEKVWKQTKKKIRKDLINLKYIKGQSGKQ